MKITNKNKQKQIYFEDLSSMWFIFFSFTGALVLHFVCFRRVGDQVKLKKIRKEKRKLIQSIATEEEAKIQQQIQSALLTPMIASGTSASTNQVATATPNAPLATVGSPAIATTTSLENNTSAGTQELKLAGGVTVKTKSSVVSHQSRALRGGLRSKLEELQLKITNDEIARKEARKNESDIQYVKKVTRNKAMRDFIRYLNEADPEFSNEKLKKMLHDEDMTASEIDELWRQVSVLTKAKSQAASNEHKIYYDYVLALKVGDPPEWISSVRDYAYFVPVSIDDREEMEEKIAQSLVCLFFLLYFLCWGCVWI